MKMSKSNMDQMRLGSFIRDHMIVVDKHVEMESDGSNYDQIMTGLESVDAINALKRLGSFIREHMLEREDPENSPGVTTIITKKYDFVYGAIIESVEAHNPGQNVVSQKFFQVCKMFSESMDVDSDFVDLDNNLSPEDYDILHEFLHDLRKFVGSESNAIDLGSAFVVTFNAFKGTG